LRPCESLIDRLRESLAAFFSQTERPPASSGNGLKACDEAYQIWSAERPKVVGLEEKIEAVKDVHAEAWIFFTRTDRIREAFRGS
jgi:hypothetical protein